jgi:chromosome segregation and condensation protein ScpB
MEVVNTVAYNDTATESAMKSLRGVNSNGMVQPCPQILDQGGREWKW